jgi:hypothetical protein
VLRARQVTPVVLETQVTPAPMALLETRVMVVLLGIPAAKAMRATPALMVTVVQAVTQAAQVTPVQ